MSQTRYVATFAPGFERIIETLLLETVPGASVSSVSSGIVFFTLSGSPDLLVTAAFFNNVFLIVNEWKVANLAFDRLVHDAARDNRLAAMRSSLGLDPNTSYRVRYSRENQFCSVDKKTMEAAERHITQATGLKADRFDPGMEFWYFIRREGQSYFALRLTKKQSTEKYLRPGELRPEIVQLIVALSGLQAEDSVVLDPFAGYGSIPAQLALLSVAPGRKAPLAIHASDIDPERSADLARRFADDPAVRVRRCDALHLDHLDSLSVDLVVTDPPWGFWEGAVDTGALSIADLYRDMLREFERVLKRDGRAVILTGAKREMEEAVAGSPHFSSCAAAEGFRTDILVNGKKSAVFYLKKS